MVSFRTVAVLCAAFLSAAVQAAPLDFVGSRFSPLRPPAIPLAVRSPYLSTWLNGDSGGILPGSWPRFWSRDRNTGWQGLVRVDGTVYNFMGGYPGPEKVNQTAFHYSSTKSIFFFDVAGKVSMSVTFLSPVFSSDLLRQSMPVSYMQVSVSSSDGKKHDVQVYSDISGEWASSDDGRLLTWDHGDLDRVGYHQIQLASPSEFEEVNDMAEWGTWFYATDSNNGVTYRTGEPDIETRNQFIETGRLDNSKSSNFRVIRDGWPVFALSHDLGTVTGASREVLFAIGLVQQNVINFQGNATKPEALAGLWTTQYRSASDAMVSFFHDFDHAWTVSGTLDDKIQNDAVAAAGQDYASLATLAVRQTFGGLQVAHGTQQDYVFLKEISSDGDIQTVDVIFPAHPILLYLNPYLVKQLLDPLFENQESGHYPNAWSVHDLGAFPNALGYPTGNDEAMPVEECGNMIIMALAYAQRTGDNAYLARHWPLLQQWAQFLVDDSLIPAYQLSTDDFAGKLANQTNLALKGIIGIAAMAEIASRTGLSAARAPGRNYRATAERYIAQWRAYGIAAAASPPHTTLAYGQNDTHGLLYNLYADRLLKLNLVPAAVYDMQSAFYPTVATDYGLALDSRHAWAKVDWQVFVAAIASHDTRTSILAKLVRFVTTTNSNHALTDLYDVNTSNFPTDGPSFMARPVLGAIFALLALQ